MSLKDFFDSVDGVASTEFFEALLALEGGEIFSELASSRDINSFSSVPSA